MWSIGLPYLPTALQYMGYSFTRMVLAYSLSLAFAVIYGYIAATNRVAEKILLPILDILQSVPILGFFPVAIVFFIDLTGPKSFLGPNLASIFLIFTSMSWNMAFGVYESIKTLPSDLSEVGSSVGLGGLLRFRKLLFPAMANRLIYNSVLSWTAGWYYLVTSEIISTAVSTTTLPGIGSYLLIAAGSDNANEILTGVIVLVGVIVLLDLLLWRPLGKVAERYRFDTSPTAATEGDTGPAFRRVTGVMGRAYARGASVVRVMALPFARRGSTTPDGSARTSWAEETSARAQHPLLSATFRYIAIGTALVAGWLIVIAIAVSVFSVYTHPIAPAVMAYVQLVPAAIGLSAVRIVVAYLISLAIALPLAVYLFRHARARAWGLPVIQVVAAIPATALFPLFLFNLRNYIGTEAAVIFVIVTGMIWYLFFNILSGLRTIPPDLEEAANSMGLQGGKYYRRLVFPGIFSAFVTGSITAMGGGWNTLIIAEYLHYGPHSIQVLGIGELIDLGVYPVSSGGIAGGTALMVAALLTLVVTVVAVNKVVWKPLYRLATEKYRYD